MYSFGASAFAGSTIAPACTPVYSFGASVFAGSTIAPACTPVYSLGASVFAGSTIAPACTPLYSGFTSTAGFTNFSPFGVIVLTAFFVPFSIISETGAFILVEINSLETSFPSTVNTLITSVFLPIFPCCFTLVVPSGNWLLFTVIWLYCIGVSTVLSVYNNSGLVSFPANTSSCGFTVLTPNTFSSSFLVVFSITFLSSLLLLFSNIFLSSFLSVLVSVFLSSCLLSITFVFVISFNCGWFLSFCCEITLSLLSSFIFLVSASFLINPTKLYPGIAEISGNLSPTFRL